MSPAQICVLTLAGGGVTGAVTYGMYYNTNSSRIVKSEINEILLTKESEDEAWGQHYEEYKKADDNLKIKDLNFSSEVVWKSEIREWCLKALEVKWSNNNFYESIEKANLWCTDTENIGNRIKRTLGEGKEFIPHNSQDSEWETAWNAYNNGKGTSEIGDLKDENKAGGKGKIKAWCTNNQGLHASSNKDLKNSMRSWCTRTKATTPTSTRVGS